MVRTVYEILAEMQADTIAENPDMCDWSLHSILRRTTIPFAKQIMKLEIMNQNAQIAQNPNTATGADLDELVKDRGLTRLSGTKAIGQVNFVRLTAASMDVVIPAATMVQAEDTDGEGPVLFVTTAEATITTGNSSVAVLVEAVRAGVRGNVRAAAINSMPGGVWGVDYVTNPLAFLGGSDQESDDDLRQRYIATATEYGRATVPTMKEYLEATIGEDDTDIVREAKVYNKGGGDIEAIVDVAATEANIASVVASLEECISAGISARGMLSAHLEDGANVGDLGDTAGGKIWFRALQNVTTEDTISIDYLYVGGGAVAHTATATVPAGTVVGQCIEGTLEDADDEVLSIPDPPVYEGSFSYQVLVGYGEPPLLFLVPEKVTIDVALSYSATDTPESDLEDLIEASITAFLDDFRIGDELQFSDLYDAARMQYLGGGEWGSRFVGIDEISVLEATDGSSTITALGEKITIDTDARIEPGTVTLTEV